MNLEQLTEFFEWMTLISVSVFFLSTILVIMLKNVIGKIHGKLFSINEENVTLMAYGYLGLFKVLIIIFILVPYVALLLMQ